MNFLEKIQNLPLADRKRILWVAVTTAGIILLFFVIRDVKQNLQELGDRGSINVDFPSSLTEELEEMKNLSN